MTGEIEGGADPESRRVATILSPLVGMKSDIGIMTGRSGIEGGRRSQAIPP